MGGGLGQRGGCTPQKSPTWRTPNQWAPVGGDHIEQFWKSPPSSRTHQSSFAPLKTSGALFMEEPDGGHQDSNSTYLTPPQIKLQLKSKIKGGGPLPLLPNFHGDVQSPLPPTLPTGPDLWILFLDEVTRINEYDGKQIQPIKKKQLGN